jgi:hypothetical protein
VYKYSLREGANHGEFARRMKAAGVTDRFDIGRVWANTETMRLNAQYERMAAAAPIAGNKEVLDTIYNYESGNAGDRRPVAVEHDGVRVEKEVYGHPQETVNSNSRAENGVATPGHDPTIALTAMERLVKHPNVVAVYLDRPLSSIIGPEKGVTIKLDGKMVDPHIDLVVKMKDGSYQLYEVISNSQYSDAAHTHSAYLDGKVLRTQQAMERAGLTVSDTGVLHPFRKESEVNAIRFPGT